MLLPKAKLTMHGFIQRLITAIILVLFVSGVFFYAPPALFSALCIVGLIYLYSHELPRLFVNPYMWIIGLIYPILPTLIIIVLNHSPDRTLIAFLILAVSGADIGGYIAGNLWGTHKLAPRISPHKTWEGLLGGFIGCSGVLLILQNYSCGQIYFPHVAIVGFFTTIVSLIGDLFESGLKRIARVKDSGMILPGHGGLLDRIDGLLFVIPLFWLSKEWLLPTFCL